MYKSLIEETHHNGNGNPGWIHPIARTRGRACVCVSILCNFLLVHNSYINSLLSNYIGTRSCILHIKGHVYSLNTRHTYLFIYINSKYLHTN